MSQWLEHGYPEIAARAKQGQEEIHWGDKTGVNNEAYNARGFVPRGKAPIIRLNARRSSINMISSITNQGKVRFMLYRETMRAPVLIKFMFRLIRDVDKKVFLIVDNHRVHHSKRVKKWLDEHRRQIEVFYLKKSSICQRSLYNSAMVLASRWLALVTKESSLPVSGVVVTI